MAVFVYKEKINGDNVCIAFNCSYNENNHLMVNNTQFDSGDYSVKIKKVIQNLNNDLYKIYLEKNKDVYYLAICDYLYENIPNIFSIKFIDDHSESIYYLEDVKKAD